MKIPNGGELLVDCLVRQGVKHVFSIIGGQMATIYDAIGSTPDIQVVTPRCETSAALMACGYTASSGRPCVSMATVGAGVVYEVPGLSKAWFDYIPVISIAPQVQSYRVKPHQESLQACNQDELFFPITKWNTIVFHWGRIPQMVDRAFREAVTGIPGPTHLDVPVDVLFKRRILTERKERRILVDPGRTRYDGPVSGDSREIHSAVEAVGRAQKPLVVVGQGIGRAGRYRGIAGILEELGMPVVTTTVSSGIMSGKHMCYAGDAAMLTGAASGLYMLKAADLVILVGIDRYSKELLPLLDGEGSKSVVQVEVDPRAFLTGRTDHYAVHADPRSALAAIRDGLADEGKVGGYETWRDESVAVGKEAAEANAGDVVVVDQIVRLLGETSTDRDIIVADGEYSTLAAACLLTKATYKDLFIMDGRDITGAGLPFALGASMANPGERVILVSDKNALFCHIRELQPAVCEGVGITILCIDDAPGEANVADTASVLAGLGCDVTAFDSEGEGADFRACKSDVPSALLFETNLLPRENRVGSKH